MGRPPGSVHETRQGCTRHPKKKHTERKNVEEEHTWPWFWRSDSKGAMNRSVALVRPLCIDVSASQQEQEKEKEK